MNNQEGDHTVLFVTQNQKLFTQLDKAMPENMVLKTEDLKSVNKAIKSGYSIGAVVLHITNSNSWIIFEVLKTTYPDIPRFAVLNQKTESEGYAVDEVLARYGAMAVIREAEIEKIVPLVTQVLLYEQNPDESDTKSAYMKIYGEVHKELARLNKDFFTTGMRTMPQNEIGADSLERLGETLSQLKAIRIRP